MGAQGCALYVPLPAEGKGVQGLQPQGRARHHRRSREYLVPDVFVVYVIYVIPKRLSNGSDGARRKEKPSRYAPDQQVADAVA